MPAALPETPRRHSIGTPLKSQQRDFVVPLNDDAKEKSQRRKSLVESVRRKSLLLGSPTVASGSGGQNITPQRNGARQITLEVVTPIPKIPVEQMYNNFEEWMKMATDNKINANNSWKLALIDYFHEMSLLKEGDSINFQKASCTLDGCVKIYTSRVDSVATETGKLLSGLADSTKNDNDQLSENEDEGEGADPERRHRKKTTRSEATLVKDYSQLTVKKFDLEFSVDPLFKKTSADFDEGGAQGLLLNHLSIDADGKIIFDASDAVLEDSNEEDSNAMDEDIAEQTMDLSKLRSKFYYSLSRIFTKDICPSLKNFAFFGENNIDLGFLVHRGSDDEDENDRFSQGESNNFFLNTDGEGGDFPDFFDNDNFLDDDGVNEEGISGVFENEDVDQRRLLTENDFVVAMANNENDMFSYFDSAFLRNWAGPEHWKLKRVAKDTQAETNSNSETRERKKKEVFSIDFIGSEDVNESTIFASGGNSLILPKLAEHVSHGYRLPDDIHFSSKQLLHLFLKPDYMLKVRRRYEQLVESDDVEVNEEFWADGNNNEQEENTSFPDMTMVTTGDTFFQDDDGFDDEVIDEREFGDNLVSQARRTKPEYIKFARTAKRIDVKKLKDNIWRTLAVNSQENGRRSSMGNTRLSFNNDQVEGLSTTQEQVREQKFTDVIKNLTKIYPEKKMKDISVPFCFICLLHLANEKNLSISANKQLTELEIKKVE
ncbi:15355_t:CDS:10 [Acaulospora morrowiae]|uniref:Condensin complex subunit 2 n=1 Tax=Acaulospora morrowiae TaxID=94023 RepID=A0A9N9GX47_9GLOM|nr:15355_t:CDS:10 [Acaulospora morrowiae]